MVGYGIPEAEIAAVNGIDAKALRRHYRHELDHGRTKANALVAESLYRRATGDGREAVTAAIFWLKTRAGWKETNVHEVTGSPLVVVWTGVPRPGDAEGTKMIDLEAARPPQAQPRSPHRPTGAS